MGHQHIAQRLIDAGAHVNAVSGFNTTPLQQAAGAGETELMALLLDRGAEVNYQPPGGGDTALLSAALNSNSTAVELLLKRHADLERTNRFGGTALMAAASWGHTAICSDLLRAGAKLDVTNRAGDNALALAIKRYNFETAGVLIVAGATVEPQTNSPEAVFHGAVYRKLLADKHAADGRNAEARADYTAAHASFTAVREQFANATQSKEADTMKASATAERKAFWGNLAEGAARAAVQGAIQGLVVGSANAAARHSNLDTEYFVISSSQPAGSSGHLTGFGAGDAAQARQYESEADRLRENVKLCDQFIQEIQNKLNP
jgi:ankyrin repeat protein